MCTCQSRHVDTLIHVHKKLIDTLCTTILLHSRETFELCVGSLYAPFPPCASMCANARHHQVTIGQFGQEEEVISNPLSPGVIQGIIYSKCLAEGGEQEAVLQQELVIHIGWIISNNPELFSGMLKIRVG